MSYQVLARKWRPQNFAQLVGQDHVKAALTNALSQNRLHHAYLFTGTRGVGKTTIARIFAKSLNCEQGVTATPCGVCSACVEIDKGYFVDLLEIDAASRTKVEDTRDLLDNVQYAPSRGRYKVYLIDEVHMLSKHSFNALLKTLEEPPPHVKFLLATTDPQKLPITVLSRCLQFSLKALSQSQIKQHLSYILSQEQISAEDEALALLARAAKGSLRDSLSLTDQAIAQTNGHIELGPVREMLGYLEQSWAELLLQDVLNRDLAKMQQHLYQLIVQHSQFQSVLDDMLSLLHLAALAQFQLSAAELALTESAFVRAIARAQSPESIQLYYQLLLSGKRDLAYAPDPRTGLEMALLRAIAFVPGELPTPSHSGRTAALSAAGIPTSASASSPLPHTSTVAATPSAQPSVVVDTTPAPATVAALQVEELPVAAVHTEQVTLPNEPHTATFSASSAVEPAATPAIDPLTASIMARRGMSAAVLAAGAESLKKSESQPPAAAIVPAVTPAVTPTVTPVAAPSSAVPPATRSALDVVMANQASSSVPARAAMAPLPVAPADVPPWQQDEITAAPTQCSPRQVFVDPPTVLSSIATESVQPAATASTQETWQDEDAFQHAAASVSMAENVAAAQPSSPLGDDEEPDPVADSAGGDWAWQQYQTHEDDSSSQAQVASLPAVDVLLQNASDSHAQPIRHALLDSLQVLDPDNTDFAEELPTEQIQLTQVPQQLVFNGVIDAHNFAVRTASQVDSWAARIDQLTIGGLMRLFLLHASPHLDDSVDPVRLHLRVSQSQQHLDSEKNRLTLQQVLSASYGMPLALLVEFLPQVLDCPLAIQQQIDQARHDYVRQLLATDPLVMAFQQQFSAEILPDTLAVN
jgi:DNA polymerase-3 subunit gamma/tau